MSTKRILIISIIGIVLIAAMIGILLFIQYRGHDEDLVKLPATAAPAERPGEQTPDALDRVEVDRDTIQAVVSSLSRPAVYNRVVSIVNYWQGGEAAYEIRIYVDGDITSIRTKPSAGAEKRIIITSDMLYIWYINERSYYAGTIDSSGDGLRTSDEWQMLVTYEDILELDKNDIIDAGYVEYDGHDCIYAVYLSPLLRYTRTYYISRELGLVIAAEEHDESGELVYSMKAGECIVGESDQSVFILPDGRYLGGGA